MPDRDRHDPSKRSVQVRLDPETYARVVARARVEDRPVASIVRLALRAYVGTDDA